MMLNNKKQKYPLAANAIQYVYYWSEIQCNTALSLVYLKIKQIVCEWLETDVPLNLTDHRINLNYWPAPPYSNCKHVREDGLRW